jgi:hypothetical protein
MSSKIVFFITAPQRDLLRALRDGKPHNAYYGGPRKVADALSRAGFLAPNGNRYDRQYTITKRGHILFQILNTIPREARK